MTVPWDTLRGKDTIASRLWQLNSVREVLQMYQAKIKFIICIAVEKALKPQILIALCRG